MSRRAPLKPAAVAVSPDETLTALARMLDYAAPGRFVLAFVKCNLPAQRRDLVERIKVLVEPLDVALLEVELTGPVDKLLSILRERLAGSYLIPSPEAEPAREAESMPALHERGSKAALFVYGLEHSLPSSDRNPPILAHLNLSRELFRRDVLCPLVIWLPDYALTKVAQGAPDFWAWRSGVYEFPPEPETAQRMARMTVYDEAGHVTSSLSEEAKRERLRLLARLLDDYRELGDSPHERSTQAGILGKMGEVHYDLGEWAEARRLYDESLSIVRELGDKLGIAQTLHNLAAIAQATGDLTEARRLYDEARRTFQELGAKQEQAAVLHQLGTLAQSTGDLAEARHLYGQSLTIRLELGDKRGIAQTLHQLGWLTQAMGDLAEARRLYDQSLAIDRELHDKQGIAITLHNLATTAQDTGDVAEARRLYDQSLAIERELGDKRGIAITLHQLGRLAEDTGDLAEARRLYAQSLAIKRDLGDKQGIAITLHQLGRLAEDEGNLAEAAQLFEESLKLLTELGSPDAQVARRSWERVRQRMDNE